MTREMPAFTKEAALVALIGGNDVSIQALDSTHGYVTGTTEFLGDLVGGSFLGTPYTFTSVDTTDGYLRTEVATISGVLTAETVAALVIYVDTGVAGTSRIIEFCNENADGTPMSRAGVTGQDITTYPTDYITHF